LYNVVPTVDKDVIVRLQNSQIQEEEKEITREEVAESVRQLKEGKSAGLDNIKGELIKGGGDVTIDLLLKIYNKIWSSGEWPSLWTPSIVIPLP